MAKQGLSTLFALLAVAAFTPATAAQQQVPSIPFDATEPLKLPIDVYFGEVAGVALNSKRHVFVYTRTNTQGASITEGQRAQLFEFGPDGEFVKEIGRGLYSMAWAHSVRIDKQDNIWLVDNGSDEIVELGADYRKKMVLGRREESVGARNPRPPVAPGTPVRPARPGYFNEPTDVAWDLQGNIFISDGYRNTNVHKFDKDGNNVKLVGGPGGEPLQFKTPHGIAVDKKGMVYVADRGNGRIQVLDNNLNFVREMKYQTSMPKDYVSPLPDFGGDGRGGSQTQADANSPVWSLWPNTICITPGDNGEEQYIYTHDMFPGYLQKFSLDGKLLGEVRAGAGRKVGQVGWIHALACVSENEVWVGELLNWRVQKFVLHPDRAAKR